MPFHEYGQDLFHCYDQEEAICLNIENKRIMVSHHAEYIKKLFEFIDLFLRYCKNQLKTKNERINFLNFVFREMLAILKYNTRN